MRLSPVGKGQHLSALASSKLLYHRRPINPSDIFCLTGQYAGFRPQLPAVPGLEGEEKTTSGAKICSLHALKALFTTLQCSIEHPVGALLLLLAAALAAGQHG